MKNAVKLTLAVVLSIASANVFAASEAPSTPTAEAAQSLLGKAGSKIRSGATSAKDGACKAGCSFASAYWPSSDETKHPKKRRALSLVATAAVGYGVYHWYTNRNAAVESAELA